MRTKEDLKMLQALPLEIKILKTQQRIREWKEAEEKRKTASKAEDDMYKELLRGEKD